MSDLVSQPSRPLHYIDVPEVNNLNGLFVYNYFTRDESTNDNLQLSDFVKLRSFDNFSDSDITLKSRVPRFVKVTWTPSKLYGSSVVTQNLLGDSRIPNLITSNYNKIVFEDQISSLNFCAITLNDGSIDRKIYAIVSGSYDLHVLGEQEAINSSNMQRIANIKNLYAPDEAKLAIDYISQPDLSYGILKKKNQRHVNSQNDIRSDNLKSKLFESLKKVNVNFSLNTRIGDKMIEKSIRNPFCVFTEDLFVLRDKLKEMNAVASSTRGAGFSELDYRPKINIIEEVPIEAIDVEQYQELVGYVIDKYEILIDGTIKQHNPIIVENSKVSSIIDSNVKYGTIYVYSIRTIALIQMPMSNFSTGQLTLVKFLVSSKSSENVYVETKEHKAPPHPADIKFFWDYSIQKLCISWSMPVDSQRDIKRFQVFRRAKIEHPFELIKEYNFDDSDLKYPNYENPHPKLVSRSNNGPETSFIDEEFEKESKYIYALCSVDAHGLTSNYSAQFEIIFDKIKNQINKKIISHSGAPKPYPNLYLPGNGTVDVAHTYGTSSKKMTIFFTPQCYQVVDSAGLRQKTFETSSNGGVYKFNFINVDNQKNEIIDVVIDGET